MTLEGVGRSNHGMNAVATRLGHISAVSGSDSIVGSAGILHPANSTQILAHWGPSDPGSCPALQYADAYRMKCVAVGSFGSGGGAAAEAVIAYGMDVERYALDAEGISSGRIRSLGCARSNLSFSDVVTLSAPTGTRPDTVLLGSAPNGDDTLYNLDFGGAESTAAPGMVAQPEEDWTQVVGGLEWRGRVATINAAVGAIDAAARANNRSFPPVVGAEPLTINLEAYVKFGGSPPVNVSTLVVELIERHSFYANRFPYPERIR